MIGLGFLGGVGSGGSGKYGGSASATTSTSIESGPVAPSVQFGAGGSLRLAPEIEFITTPSTDHPINKPLGGMLGGGNATLWVALGFVGVLVLAVATRKV